MSRHREVTLISLLIVSLCLTLGPLRAADEKHKVATELSSLRIKIQAIQRQLSQSNHRKSALTDTLRKSSREVSTISKAVKKLATEMARIDADLKSAERQMDALGKEQNRLRFRLAEQTRNAMLVGNRNRSLRLLRGEDADAAARLATYHRFFAQARSKTLAQLVKKKERVSVLREELRHKRSQLRTVRSKHSQRRSELDAQRAENQSALAKLKRDLARKGDELAELRANEADLAQLLENLSRSLIVLSDALDQPFKGQKGSLHWPVKGEIRHHYGAPREGGATWSGVWLDVPADTEVRAVAYGRIAYADWLRGYGLLIIIDHGEDYMTLYGQNQVLFKEVGDWVQTEEIIANGGQPENRQKAASYFEIRHLAKAINPVPWMVRR